MLDSDLLWLALNTVTYSFVCDNMKYESVR